MANNKPMGRTKAKVPVGVADVEIEGDSRTVDGIITDFLTALDPTHITNDLLRLRFYGLMRERARNRFAEQGDDASGPWAPLRPYTLEERKRGGFGAGPINVRTGEMRTHVIDRPPAATKNTLGGTLWFPAPGGSKINLDKVRTAQSGRDKPKTPARPVIAVSLTDMELLLVATSEYLGRYVRGGRFV